MKLNLSLLENDSAVRKLILDAFSEDLSSTIKKAIPEIKNSLSLLIEEALKQEPEYNSLVNGKLRAEFGIQDTTIVDSVVKKISDTVDISFSGLRSSSNGISGRLSVTAISSDNIGGLLSDNDATVQDSSRGYSLPWLQWLTLMGTSPIIKNYKVRFGSSPYSRSGSGIMVEDEGNQWSVPAEFAGVQENNWTTRAIDRIEKDIQETIIKAIEKNI